MEFIGCNMIEYCSLYDEGFSRLGCVACPLGGPKKMTKEFARWPAYRRAYIKCFERMIVERKRRGNTLPVANWRGCDGLVAIRHKRG